MEEQSILEIVVPQAIEDARLEYNFEEGHGFEHREEIISLIADNLAELNASERKRLASELLDTYIVAAGWAAN